MIVDYELLIHPQATPEQWCRCHGCGISRPVGTMTRLSAQRQCAICGVPHDVRVCGNCGTYTEVGSHEADPMPNG